MKRESTAVSLLIVCLYIPSWASANPEPAVFDMRSIALGLSGTSYLERPAALVLNPANLEGIERFSTSLMLVEPITTLRAPVRGPDNPSVRSEASAIPFPSFFVAGRIAPRVVFGAGVYILAGYGASFDGVTQIDGVSSNTTPEDLGVIFFEGEVAMGPSIRITDKLSIGLALRLPFAKQVANQYVNLNAVLNPAQPEPVNYQRVRNDLGGVGFPSPRFGITYKLNDKVRFGAMYRFYSRIKLAGTVQAATFPEFDAASSFGIPHALQAGAAITPIDKLMIALEFRAQFHGASRTGNNNQTVNVTDNLIPPIIVPFGWKNSYNARIGLEYKVNDLIDLRLGSSMGNSATSALFAQYFGVPPGFLGFISYGVGFNWEHVSLDVTSGFSAGSSTIARNFPANNSPATVPGTNPSVQQDLCSSSQVTRTGCSGLYTARVYYLGLQFTYNR